MVINYGYMLSTQGGSSNKWLFLVKSTKQGRTKWKKKKGKNPKWQIKIYKILLKYELILSRNKTVCLESS